MAFKPLRTLDVGEVTPIPAHDSDGGLNFTPNGFIGKFSSGVFSLFYIKDNPDAGYVADPKPFKADLVVPNANSITLLFKDHAKAEAAGKTYQQLAGLEKPPILNEVWRLAAPVSSLKNVDQSKFDKSPTVSFDIRIVGLRSANRHTYQLMALPGTVQAVAKYAGIELDLPNPLLNLVIAKPEDFTEEFATRFIGIPKAGKDDENYWPNSELGQWRAALWNALGEPDVTKLHNGQKPTEADELLYCLGMVGAWKNPQWCRVVQVPDPSLDATYTDRDGNVRHQRVAVVWEFFSDEKTATEVGQAELAKRAEKQAEAEPTETDGKLAEPNIPQEWRELPDEWRGAIAEALKSGRDERDIAAELSVGVPFVKSWKRYLAQG
jgi:hypothetical protein